MKRIDEIIREIIKKHPERNKTRISGHSGRKQEKYSNDKLATEIAFYNSIILK